MKEWNRPIRAENDEDRLQKHYTFKFGRNSRIALDSLDNVGHLMDSIGKNRGPRSNVFFEAASRSLCWVFFPRCSVFSDSQPLPKFEASVKLRGACAWLLWFYDIMLHWLPPVALDGSRDCLFNSLLAGWWKTTVETWETRGWTRDSMLGVQPAGGLLAHEAQRMHTNMISQFLVCCASCWRSVDEIEEGKQEKLQGQQDLRGKIFDINLVGPGTS